MEKRGWREGRGGVEGEWRRGGRVMGEWGEGGGGVEGEWRSGGEGGGEEEGVGEWRGDGGE